MSEVLDEYLRALEQGIPPAVEDLLAAHPDLAGVLASYLESLVGLHGVAAAFGGAADSPAHDSDRGSGGGAKRLGDFVLGGEIGRGGMGIVYEARQLSLSRRVALKVLPFAAVLDARQIARFKNEAQAAAQLQHPNIVPVYAVGVERGVHYYAMQFIEGQPLDRAIAQLRALTGEEAPALQDTASFPAGEKDDRETVLSTKPVHAHREASLLSRKWVSRREYFETVMRLGVQAAEALHAAHSLGVVHRDIKPSNLLLDAAGKLWVTDFGLARCQTDLSLTQTGDVVGTRQYMSPEQALGQAALVDQRTDVYSLGATLYELLTLRPAFAAEDGTTLLRRIDLEEPRPVRSLRPEVPLDLETVVNKAMARQRDERYLTAQDLADDLRRLLDGLPPVAQRPTILDRVGKWSRRHRRAVVLSMAAASVAIVGLSISLLLINRARTRAEHDYARAETYLRQAHETVDLFGSRLAERLGHVPGAEQVRREVLHETLAYYQKFIEQAADNPQLRADLATTYSKIGSLNDQMGLSKEAIAAHRQAVELLEQLAAAEPGNLEYRGQLGLAKNNLALALASGSDQPAARQVFAEAIALQRELASQQPHDQQHGLQLAVTHNNLGALLRDAGEPDRASVEFAEAIRLGSAAMEHDGDDVTALRNLATAYNNLAAIQQAKPAEAIARYRQAAQLQRQLVAAHPAELPYRSELATTLNNLAAAQSRSKQLAEAAATYRQAIDLQQELLRVVPLDRTFRRDLAVTYNNLGLTHARLAEPEAAQLCFRNALGFGEQLVSEQPDDSEMQSSLGGIYNNLGIVLEGWNRHDEAADSFASAIKHQRAALERAPRVQRYRTFLDKHYHSYGRALRALGQAERAMNVALARKQLGPRDAERLLGVAEDLALAGQVERSREPSSDVATRCEELAIDTLQDALAAGADLQAIGERAAFVSLKAYPEFDQVAGQRGTKE